jgi:hypothetical protein
VANHVRRQIREAVAAAVTGLATTGANVFQSRVYPTQTSELPALLVYTRSEDSEPSTIHSPKVLERTLQLVIAAVAKTITDLDDVLDGICKEVEIAVENWSVAGLGGIADSIYLVSTEVEMSGEGEKPAGIATMTYELSYYTQANAPDVAL